MDRSRSIQSRPGDRSSLEKLNRTIEGLEARIEGLIQSREPQTKPSSPTSPLQEIRDRQQMLAASRERREPEAQAIQPPAVPRPRLEPRRVAREVPPSAFTRPHPAAHLQRDPLPQRAKSHEEPSLQDITEAMSVLGMELKHDINEGVAREMSALRSEVSSIRSIAQNHDISGDLNADLARLADDIKALGERAGPEADALRAEYAELHAAIDGLAREESIQRLDNRWKDLEERIVELDTHELREELVGLAYRIDDIKSQLGAMSDNPAIRALEQKLLAVATAMEQLGSRILPTDASFNDQFALLDDRLDEISRAIAASGRAPTASPPDPAAFQRLETRLGALAQQIDAMAGETKQDTNDVLADRVSSLAVRIEELCGEQISSRLEEHLEQLSAMMSTDAARQDLPALADYLAEISARIDRLDPASLNEAMIDRLDDLARRIDAIDIQVPQQPDTDRAAIERIEDRLSGIAARLDETAFSPSSDSRALNNLELQIAHLSELISQPSTAAYGADEMSERVSALETYMTTNDEYVLEAARQAAEAVVDSFSRQAGLNASGVDISGLTALAEDLRHLEELTRSSEERSQHTLNALHSTLVQIADRLDTMEDRFSAPILPQVVPVPIMATAQAGNEPENLHQDMMASLAGSTVHTNPQTTSGNGYENVSDHNVEGITSDDVAVSADEPLSGGANPDHPRVKRGLLGQISSRLRPEQKPASKPGRTVIEPTPSLDPVDVLPPEHENALLEPGSGAPDVRKILERVRASQAAASGRPQASEPEHTDYIAAARRAAKAAAMETDPGSTEPVEGKQNGSKDDKAVSGTAFSKYRRPIMMAVGAVLLTVMAIPLVKTLSTGETAPPSLSEAPAIDASSNAAQPSSQQAADTASASDQDEIAAAPASTGQEAPQAAATEAQKPAGPDLAQTDGPLNAAADAQAVQALTGQQAVADASAEPPIVVPSSVGPTSLVEAAKDGDPIALFEIGSRYTDGRGVDTDLSEAANWYKLSADRGFAPAQYRIGTLFEKGTGITRDIEKAMDYYQKAADAGNVSAMHNLAVLFASGAKEEPDYKAAARWFEQAAELGVTDSQFNLAILYARGNGVPQDLVASYKWFDIAARAGDSDAGEKRDEVAKSMRQEQLTSAKALTRNWAPKPLDTDANEVSLPDEWADNTKPLTTASVDMEKAIFNIQAILNKNGFDAGAPDGVMGQKTIGAIKSFQASIGQEPTGTVNDALVHELLKRNT